MTELYGFEIIEGREIAELNGKATLYRHKATGAEYLSVENEDENKVFVIIFRTPPDDSTGVPHILEHAVLNGSEKYPLKEPFVELIKGSLNTFLNAFTYPDKTCYPVASQNIQDLYNLVDVYMDAVLHPLIPRHVLEQEGWHYELDEDEGELTYKGVVFNEMKGAFSDPQSLLYDSTQSSLFPDTAYQHNSGGDPKVIPNLTYEQFKAFHETYYHPSNARIFWYGDDDPQERLRRLNEYLQGYEQRDIHSSVALQAHFDEPRRITRFYGVSEGEDAKSYLATSWLLPEGNDPERTLALSLLSFILTGTQASPLRKALIDSGLGEDVLGGLESSLRQMAYSVGLKGFKNEDAGKVEALIEETLRKLAEEGIDPDMIAAAVNTVEFRLRENNTGSFPRGLLVMLRAINTWLHDGDPFASLAYEKPLGVVKAKAAEKGYFEGMIKEHLLENQHRATVLLEPDPDLNKREAEEESAKLAAKKAQLDEAGLQAIAENAEKLKEIQQTPDSEEALATLPSLTLSDLDPKVSTVPIEVGEIGGATLLTHDLFTNGILYMDVSYNLFSIPQEFIPFLDLFSDGLLKLGTTEMDYVRLTQQIGAKTGGIWPSIAIDTHRETGELVARLALSGKATLDTTPELLELMGKIITTVEYDNPERFKQIVLENKAGMENGLVPSGHAFINRRLRGKHSAAGWVNEQMSGISQLFFLRELVKQVESDWGSVLETLRAMQSAVFNKREAIINVTLDEPNWQKIYPMVNDFASSLPAGESAPHTWQPDYDTSNEGLTLPAQVNYVGKGANLKELGHEMDGKFGVVTNYLKTTYLWDKVRVQGGAYGGMLSFDSSSGSFNFLSYRDPNLLGTLDNYDGAAGFLRALKISKEELTKSVIGRIGDLDQPMLPDAKGAASLGRYLTGYTDEARQQYRDETLRTSAKDFSAVAEMLEAAMAHAQIAVLGGKEALEEANKERGDFLRMTKVL